MAEVIWSDPSLADLDAIADYIALDNVQAAKALVNRVFTHVDQLIEHPNSSAYVPELEDKRYGQIVEPPCRVIYRVDGETVYVLHVMRGERLFQLRD